MQDSNSQLVMKLNVKNSQEMPMNIRIVHGETLSQLDKGDSGDIVGVV